MRWLLCCMLLAVLLSTALAGRDLKTSEPALNIQFPFGSVTGGSNGEPLKVAFPGGGVLIGNKDDGCGKQVVVDVKHPAGHTDVKAGDGCKPTTVDVKAPGTSATVVADKSG